MKFCRSHRANPSHTLRRNLGDQSLPKMHSLETRFGTWVWNLEQSGTHNGAEPGIGNRK